MAVAIFCTPALLAADLATLGFPNAASPESIASAGDARVKTLAWLAAVVDPDASIPDEGALAEFWDRLGVQSIEVNSAGFRVPFTANAEKKRERLAAAAFLREAIDLALAAKMRRQRFLSCAQKAGGADEAEGAEGGDGEEGVQGQFSESCEVTEEDRESDELLSMLIAERHLLFPNTASLHAPTRVPKRSKNPLAEKRSNEAVSSRLVRPLRRGSALAEPKRKPQRDAVAPKAKPDSVEEVLRVMREAKDAHLVVAEERGVKVDLEGDLPCCKQNSLEDGSQLRVSAADFEQLAVSADNATKLVLDFHHFAKESLALRSASQKVARRDVESDRLLSEAIPDACALQIRIGAMLSGAHRMQASYHSIENGRGALFSLSKNEAVEQCIERGSFAGRQASVLFDSLAVRK